MGTLNVTNIQASTIERIGASGEFGQITFPRGQTTLVATNITWHTSYNNTSQTLGNISGATGSNVKAISILVFYQHNGSTNHGYLAGWYHQTGKNLNQGMYDMQAHYDWYYNYDCTPLVIPWDPNGTQSLQISGISAYNSSTNNTYRVYHTGIYTQD